MIALNCVPKNKLTFRRLIEFCSEVLDICNDLGVSPILSGSLAVFAYTQDKEMSVNDVDLACSETEFPKIISVLEERGISYQLKEWHVLQILNDDLKIELDSIENWYKHLSLSTEALQSDNQIMNMVSLRNLQELYKRGLKDTVNKTEENQKRKYEALKAKYEALESVKG